MPHIKTADGTELYVKTLGHGPAVVLIHGWPLTADSWDDLALDLAEAGFTAVSYDRRGFGRSDQPATGYDYDTFADDLAAVVQALNLTNFALCGFSMGGGEIARYMSRHGGRGVGKAVFISSVVPYMLNRPDNPNGADINVFHGMKQQIRADRAGFFKSFFNDFYGVGLVTSPVSQGVLDWSFQMTMQAGLKATLDCIDAFGMTDFRPDIASIRVPTLILHGTSDKTVPIDATARPLAQALPGARLVEIDGAAHGVLGSHKEIVSQDVLSFLR